MELNMHYTISNGIGRTDNVTNKPSINALAWNNRDWSWDVLDIPKPAQTPLGISV